jgi:hypothetical protein
MSASHVNSLFYILLIPAFLVIGTWPLPWERWIPRTIPTKVVGPYLLFCACAAWHFNQPWWFVLLIAAVGAVVTGNAVFELRRSRMLKQAREMQVRTFAQAREWPVADAVLLHADQRREADGVRKLTLSYMYKVHDEEFFGTESFTLPSERDTDRFESTFKGRKLRVRYQPDTPAICVLVRDEMRSSRGS